MLTLIINIIYNEVTKVNIRKINQIKNLCDAIECINCSYSKQF